MKEIKYFLAKSEPNSYSFEDLECDIVTWWDGVRNYQAILVIKSWKIGDRIFFYRSVQNPAIIGMMEVVTSPIFDVNDERKISWKAQVKLITKFEQEVPLQLIKESQKFNSYILVRNSRLSTMACPQDFVDFVFYHANYKEEMGHTKKLKTQFK